MKSHRNLWALLPVLLFIVLSFVYFSPDVIEGKILFQHDTQQGLAIGHEAQVYAQESGETPRWTGSLFSGMPTFQISPSYSSNAPLKALQHVYNLWLVSPVSLVFIMMLGFYILLLTLNVRWYLAAFGAIAYAFSSYFFIIIAAGHIWKFITLAYIPPTIAGVILAYRGRYLLGGALAALFGALQIMSNHVQMSYYFLFVICAVVVAYGVEHYRAHTMPRFFKATGVLVVAALLAVGANASNLYHTYKYSKESMRGGHTELTSPDADKTKPAGNGLDKDYITQWSYGKMETLTLLIPDSKGGASGPLAENERAVKAADPQLRPYLSQVDRYWGDQPFTAGPVYVGALIFFLFVLGCFIVRTPLKWALLVVTILTIMLSWGKNMMWLTDWFIDYFPMYNRFRTVSSILVVAEFCMPLLAVLALKKIFDDPSILSREKRWFYLSGGIVAGIALLAALFPTLFDTFLKDYELEAAGQPGYAELFAGIAEARKAVFTADAWRSFIIVALGFAVLWLLRQKKLNPTVAMIALVVILVGDMYPVNKRYLNSDNFVTPARKTNPFPMTDADRYILQDKDMNYRVLNAAAGETLASAFSEPRTSYYHKSIGGYHAAKLRRYQDLIDRQLVNANPAVLNMLNTRYIIQPLEDGRETVVRNPGALGNAWFVSEVKWVDNADAEMAAITDFDPSHTAVVDRRFAREIGDKVVPPAVGDTIYETGYKPDELTYRYRSQQGGLAVFSEIYFPWGWQVTVDGKPVDMARVNYVLRAVNLPAGEHEVIFRFDPPSVHTTEAIAYVSLFLILAAFVGTGFVAWKRRKSVPQNS
ncbi:YfhO family protein [Barnesiella viscericola]|uniref:YfhO family protein n=1 Tax=Barnesiella viscericola TaxID=397865 RepID=UPI0023570D8F|nr:YfhO family protein [Barnesiella viscericola]